MFDPLSTTSNDTQMERGFQGEGDAISTERGGTKSAIGSKLQTALLHPSSRTLVHPSQEHVCSPRREEPPTQPALKVSCSSRLCFIPHLLHRPIQGHNSSNHQHQHHRLESFTGCSISSTTQSKVVLVHIHTQHTLNHPNSFLAHLRQTATVVPLKTTSTFLTAIVKDEQRLLVPAALRERWSPAETIQSQHI